MPGDTQGRVESKKAIQKLKDAHWRPNKSPQCTLYGAPKHGNKHLVDCPSKDRIIAEQKKLLHDLKQKNKSS